MSNYSSCLYILTQLIGFEKLDNGDKILLPDEVEMDTLVEFRNFLQDFRDNADHDQISSSYAYEMKMVENNDTLHNESFWACKHCTYHNSNDSDTCQMCSLPRDVCI